VALAPGESVDVSPFARPESAPVQPQPELELRVLAQGEGWLALDKPAGMPVHPLAEDETGTLLNAAIARHPEIQGVGEGALRSGVVHRLDVDTSGVVLVARQQETWLRLREAFTKARITKVYRALVLGLVEEDGALELPLLTARHRPARVRVAREGEEAGRGVRVAKLSFRVLERFADATLVEVRPKTGFLHQIRAVFAWLGHPLAGDRAYGPASDPTGAARHMLHASELAFEEIRARSDDAPDFAELLASLRGAA
jgi:23S rRNA pseudouridine1911/1915/1917 synthase